MAQSLERKLVPWNDMRNRWVYCAGKAHRAEDVKKYFNTFVTTHPGYVFIIAKKFNDLHDVCITDQQCCEIKTHLERAFGLSGRLEDAMSLEVPWNDCTQRSFRNAQDFRQYRERTLVTMNRPVIRAKHAEARQHYSKVKDVFTKSEAFQILCFDIEVYEHERSIMLEIGYVICRFTAGLRYPGFGRQGNKPDVTLVTKRHLIIRENRHYKNGDKVPDNRYGFRFGSSETLSLSNAVRRFAEDVTECDHLLGQSVKHDDTYLKNIGVDLGVLGKQMFDTQVIQTYKESLKEPEKYFMRGLKNMLEQYNVNYEESDLHNGGCDAFYTMMVFLRQMEYSAGEVNTIIASNT